MKVEPVTPPHPAEELALDGYAIYDYNYIEQKLNELEEKAKFMMQFEGGGEFYAGFLEAIKEFRKILDEAEDKGDDYAEPILEELTSDEEGRS